MRLLETVWPSPDIPSVALRTNDVRTRVEAEGVVRIAAPGITAHGFADFMETLGTPMFTLGENPVVDLPNLNLVTNAGRTTKPKSLFHSDTTYVAHPPSFSGLFAVDVPERGGATLFTDQYRAFDRLPERLKSHLIGATVRHSVTGVDLPPDAERTARHPICRRHPGTGLVALFLTTPSRCTDLRLASGEDRSELIQKLFEHSLQAGPQRRHIWSKGDIVIWDNRCTLHAADHSDVVGNRTLLRALVRGERPICASTK